MTLKQRLELLKTFSKAGVDPKKLNFENTAVTAEGVTLYYDELAQGSPIFQKDPNGNLVAAPEGTHTLENGTTITVVLEGDMSMISEVVEAAPAPEADVPVTEPLAETPASAKSEADAKRVIRSIIEELQFTVSEDLDIENQKQAVIEAVKILQTQVKENEVSVAKFKKEAEDNSEKVNSLTELIEKMKIEPAAKPTHEPKKSKFLKGYEDPKNDALDYISRLKKVTNQ